MLYFITGFISGIAIVCMVRLCKKFQFREIFFANVIEFHVVCMI